VQTAVAAFGRLDVVVNNAGFGDIAPFEQLSAERFKAVIDTNFYGVVNVTRAAVPHMRKQRSGCILQISSVGGRLTRPGSTPYHAAKWAVGGFTESLAQELSPVGVKVCALEPGGMRTNWGARTEVVNADPPAQCAPIVVEALAASCSAHGFEHDRMISRAYHDSLFMSRIAPAGMLFIFLPRRVSATSPDAIGQGTLVLAEAIARLAG